MKKILIEIVSQSMGDTISSIPYIEEFRKRENCDVYVNINKLFNFLFIDSYPKINFVNDLNSFDFDEIKRLYYDFNKNVQEGFANQLGFNDWVYIRPEIKILPKKRPVDGKYVVINIHSTAQLKYWNHPVGNISQPFSPYWDELCKILRKHKLTPIVVEKDKSFGVPPYFNDMPSKAYKKYNLKLEDTVNIIQHCEFFIGLSSGNSWLAHALGKKVAMIANFTEDWNEFDLSLDDYIRITNKSVCHGCWNKINIEHQFDSGDWYWCPKHKNTKKQFECHTSITPEMVYEKIKKWIN
jgi:autotransporter strand-loop-strand O-heptosyltransferase